MTLKQSYESAYAAKNKALAAQYKAKKKAPSDEKKELRRQGSDTLREAYAKFLRSAATTAQTLKVEGKQDGAAQNQAAGQREAHSAAQSKRRRESAAKVAALEGKIKTEKAALDKKVADNQTALQQKLDSLAIKERAAAEKAAAKTTKSTTKSTTKATTKSQVLSMLKMGIYDSSFAGILGVSDEEVQKYLKDYQSKKKKTTVADSALDPNGKLPGTYKPPLK